MARLDKNRLDRSTNLAKNFLKFTRAKGDKRHSVAVAVKDLQAYGLSKGQAIDAILPRGSRLTY